MNKHDPYMYQSETLHSRSLAGSIATVALAAAVGAGVALLFTTEAGKATRSRVSRGVRDLELGDRAERLRGAAAGAVRHGGQKYRRVVEPEADHSVLYAALGTVAGAAIAALMAPQGGRETRQWIGHTFEDIRQNASLRWREHKARKRTPATEADAAARRLEENGMERERP